MVALLIMSAYEFTFLGSKDSSKRLTKACSAFANLQTVWKSKEYSLKTKIQMDVNSIVKSVVLYGSEGWREVGSDRFSQFQI